MVPSPPADSIAAPAPPARRPAGAAYTRRSAAEGPRGRMHFRRYLAVLCVPVLLVVLGTIGYRAVEGWPLFDALYMTVITITTVGFLEVQPLTAAGRSFTMLLALG